MVARERITCTVRVDMTHASLPDREELRSLVILSTEINWILLDLCTREVLEQPDVPTSSFQPPTFCAVMAVVVAVVSVSYMSFFI
jgi:hypothetical protein